MDVTAVTHVILIFIALAVKKENKHIVFFILYYYINIKHRAIILKGMFNVNSSAGKTCLHFV
jgi:hypothetical protein